MKHEFHFLRAARFWLRGPRMRGLIDGSMLTIGPFVFIARKKK